MLFCLTRLVGKSAVSRVLLPGLTALPAYFPAGELGPLPNGDKGSTWFIRLLEDKHIHTHRKLRAQGTEDIVYRLFPPPGVSTSSGQDFFSLHSQPLAYEWMQNTAKWSLFIGLSPHPTGLPDYPLIV